jgi:hypothetical protein
MEYYRSCAAGDKDWGEFNAERRTGGFHRGPARADGRDFAADSLVVREHFERMLATIPVAEDLTSEAVTLGGVTGFRFKSPSASADRALLYFHSGAYMVGSATGYRALASELGRASGAVSFAVDYRLASEYVFPAAIEDAMSAYRGRCWSKASRPALLSLQAILRVAALPLRLLLLFAMPVCSRRPARSSSRLGLI